MKGNLRYSLGVLGGRLGAQWEKERRDTLFLMLGAGLSVVPHIFHLPLWVSIGFVMLFVWRLGLILSGRWLPRDSVRWVAAAACIIAVYVDYKTLLGRDSGVALLVLFLGLKLMEMKARRDLFVVIFLCFFLLVTSFFYSQSFWAALIVILAVWALLAAMLTMHYGASEVAVTQRFKSIGQMLLQAAPLAAALFFLFPRINQPLWGLPSDAHSGRTGISDQMAPGSISSLSSSQEVAFRAKFDGLAPNPSEMYWRGPVFGDFDGKQWQALSRSLTPRVPPSIRQKGKASFDYTLTLEPSNQRWLFALDPPAKVDDPSLLDIGAQLNADAVLQSRDAINSRIRYRASASQFYAMGADDPVLGRQNWLDLPPSFNPKTLELAAQWQRETPDPEALVQRTLTYISEEKFYYTMKPPLLGRNSVDDFLFNTRSGFCEHYSSAFVVLMRALDIPARVVTGYQGGEQNPVDKYWVIKQGDAHAWAEVWIAGKGWVRIDPTSAVSPDRVEKGSQAVRFGKSEDKQKTSSGWLDKFKFNADALSNTWNQWVLNYDRNAQKRLLDKLGFDFTEWREIAGLFAAVLGLLIGIAALITLRPRLPKDPTERVWKNLCDRLEDKGWSKASSETAKQFYSRVSPDLNSVQSKAFADFYLTYNKLRYEGEVIKRKDVRHLRALAKRFKL